MKRRSTKRKRQRDGAETTETAETVGRLETPKHGGGKLMRGNPGQRSGGRTPKRFKNWCRSLLAKGYTTRQVRDILRGKKGDVKDFKGVLDTLAKYGYHELTQTTEIKANKTSLATLLGAPEAK